jgi:tRNA-splicing endonuclease subunit Sen54
MPTLHELDNLFAELPVLLPPQPRKRIPNPDQAKVTDPKASDITTKAMPQVVPRTLIDRIRHALGLTVAPATTDRPPPRPNPFVALKQGKKIIVIAVVDAGSIGFFRFGQGCFEEWPMA